MSDYHATERIIAGLIIVGVGSLLSWSVSQNGESGFLGMALVVAMVIGGLWSLAGLVELLAAPRSPGNEARIGVPSTEQSQPRN
jgi:predicted cation transporter